MEYFPESELLNEETATKLNEWIGETKKWKRVYSSSINLLQPEDFHATVDNKGECIVLVESENGSVFGGYTSVGFIPEGHQGSIYRDDHHFLFTLKNPWNIPPTMFKNKYSQTSILYVDVYGPCFGSHSDFCIRGHSGNFELSHTIGFPWSYEDSTGKGNKVFTGDDKFTVKRMEVFCV